MKKDKVQALKNKTRDELYELIASHKEKLGRLRFDLKSGKTANIKELHELKKEIAVASTYLHNHETKS